MAYPYYPQNYPQQNYPQQTQIQNGGFLRASEEEARNYPVAPGYSVTFIDETSTHLFTKTAGFSQFDKPVFKKFRLISEDEPIGENTDIPEYALKTDFEKLKADFKKLKAKVDKSDD